MQIQAGIALLLVLAVYREPKHKKPYDFLEQKPEKVYFPSIKSAVVSGIRYVTILAMHNSCSAQFLLKNVSANFEKF